MLNRVYKPTDLNEEQLRHLSTMRDAYFDDNGILQTLHFECNVKYRANVEDLGHLNIRKEDIKKGLTEEQFCELYRIYDYAEGHKDLDQEPEIDCYCDLLDWLHPIVDHWEDDGEDDIEDEDMEDCPYLDEDMEHSLE